MDTGEYDTNALLIKNISSVEFACYDPTPTPAASNAPLASHALDLERALRDDGYIAHVDVLRRRVWCFRLVRKDDSPPAHPDSSSFPQLIDRCAYSLAVTHESAFEPARLPRAASRFLRPNHTPTSSISSAGNGAQSAPANGSSDVLVARSGAEQQDNKSLVPSDSPKQASTTSADAHEAFIVAATAAASAAFCTSSGALPLNHRTFLLPRPEGHGADLENPAVLASLRIYLTTAGALVLELALTPAPALVSVSDFTARHVRPLSMTVLAAPLGAFGTCQALPTADHAAASGSLAHSPDTQMVRSRHDKDETLWRNISSKLLLPASAASSLQPSGSLKALNLHRLRRRPADQRLDGKRTPMVGAQSFIPWPSSLCFCKLPSSSPPPAQLVDRSSPLSGVTPSYDPLSLAKNWFFGSSEREEALTKKKLDREAHAATEQTSTTASTNNSNMLSPLALRRSSNTAAAPGSIYPTPPDAIQNPVGATPSHDGTQPSPNLNPVIAPSIDIDPPPPPPQETFDEDQSWDTPEPKQERAGSTFDADNLFGDLGPDMFGDSITDADFNFFDDQPEGLGLGPLDMSGMPPSTEPGQSFSADAFKLEEVVRPKEEPAHAVSVPPELPAPSPPAPPAPSSPVFAKPELRHARSSLLEEQNRQAEVERVRQASLKRPASPLDPDTVYKRIKASFDNDGAALRDLWGSTSVPSSVQPKAAAVPSLADVNKKYQNSGRFDFPSERPNGANLPDLKVPPTTGYLDRHGKGRKGLKDLPANSNSQLCLRVPNEHDRRTRRSDQINGEEDASDADELSLVSDNDDSDPEPEEPVSPAKSMAVKRRRAEDDRESVAASHKDYDYAEAKPSLQANDLSWTFKPGVDFPLTKFFADPEPSSAQYNLGDEAFVITAQILMDQASTSSFGLGDNERLALKSKADDRRDLLTVGRNLLRGLRKSLPLGLSDAVGCQFRPLIEVPDASLLTQSSRMQPRPPGADQGRPTNLFQFPAPRFELRRYDTKLSLLPSSIPFWESLGLGPSQGGKDVNAICIFPDMPGLADAMLAFTDRMRSIYESFKLGSFVRLPEAGDIANGLVPFETDKILEPFRESSSILGPSLLGGISRLCKALASLGTQETNFVVFFAFTPSAPGSTVESCIAFHQLFEGYKKMLQQKRMAAQNEIVLQLVPMDFVACADSIASPLPNDLAKLALELYDRCTLFGGAMPSPAIVLEQTPPRHIDFKLNSNPSASLLHENSCLHVAYAQSMDERWVSVAWTDNRGSQQLTASYCLGRKGKSIATPMSDITREIWETTRELISPCKVHWRIIIAKCGGGGIDSHELELWTSLAQAETRSSMSLTLVAVDPNPSLQLLPPSAKVPSTAHTALYTTPVSTPQASVLSPEQSANPATPMGTYTAPTPGSGDHVPTPVATTTPAGSGLGSSATADPSTADADSTLVDVTDHTWGAVLAHRLPGMPTLSQQMSSAELASPAASLQSLVSGYLVKRSGARVEDPPALLEVSIIYTDGNRGAGTPGANSGGGASTPNGGSGVSQQQPSPPISAQQPSQQSQQQNQQQLQQVQQGQQQLQQQASQMQTAQPQPPSMVPSRAYEPLLREVLVAYRNLGTLARARALVDREADPRPWHVAAAEKGLRAMYLLM